MSNVVPVTLKLPAHLAKRIGKGQDVVAANLGSGLTTGPSFARISIKSSRFRLIEGGAETVLNEPVLRAAIVNAGPGLAKTYYATEWDPDADPSGPDCFSMDGIRPDSSVAEPICDLCAKCPKGAWGSKTMPNGKKAKACTDHKRLAVVAAEDPEGAVYLLQVTPSALGGLNQYHKELSRHGVSPNMVITNIGFDSKASYPKLTFSYGGFLDEEAYNTVADRVQSDEVLEIIGMQPKQSVPVVEDEDEDEYVQEVIAEPVEAPKPKAKKGFGGSSDEPKPKAKAKPTPVVEDDEDEDDDSGVAVIEDLTELGDLFGD
jgi:hypothetical protein